MVYPIVVTAAGLTLHARLDDTPTARQVWDALPVDASVSRWGGEVYFPIPVQAELEPGARDVLAVGEVAFWPAGQMLCLFFGPTPASIGDEPCAASPVNVVGHIVGDATTLRDVPDGAPIRVIRAVV